MKTYRKPNYRYISVYKPLVVVYFGGYIVKHILDIMMSLCRRKGAKNL